MPVIESQIDPRSDEFKRNREGMLAAIEELRAAEKTVQAVAERARGRFKQRKQLMPRERVALLLDRGVSWEDVAQALSVKVILLDVASVMAMASCGRQSRRYRYAPDLDGCRRVAMLPLRRLAPHVTQCDAGAGLGAPAGR